MSEANKQVALRYFELVAADRLADLKEVFAPDFVDRTAMPDMPAGVEGLRALFEMMRSAFPDFTVTPGEVVAEGDMVAARFTFEGTHEGELMGVPASGKRVTMGGMDMFRIRDGLVTELWGYEDLAGLMDQIGDDG